MEQSEVANVTQMIKNANSSKSSSSSKSSNKSKLEESALMQTFIEADLMR